MRLRPLKEPEGGPEENAGEEELTSAEWAVGREEKRNETAVLKTPLLVMAVTFIRRDGSFPDRFAKVLFGRRLFGSPGIGSSGVF